MPAAAFPLAATVTVSITQPSHALDSVSLLDYRVARQVFYYFPLMSI